METHQMFTLPLYHEGELCCEISRDTLIEFLGDEKDPKNIYFHKLNFNLGTALHIIKQETGPLPEGYQRRMKIIKLRTWLLRGAAACAAAVLLFLAWDFFNASSSFSGIGKRFGKIMTINAGVGEIKEAQLPDGTKVWLNAGSTINYPEKFFAEKRVVELDGEAYFEVVADKDHPFLVKSGKQLIEVLGTRFTVSDYSNDNLSTTVLLEGGIKLHSTQGQENGIVLNINQESRLQNGKFNIFDTEADDAIAWKNGEFNFRNEPLENIMRKLNRWYGVIVVFEDESDGEKPFGGTISKSFQLAEVLKMLELTGDVKFILNGNKVTVTK